jgi:hypothetical protein
MRDAFALIVCHVEMAVEGMEGNILGIVPGTEHATHIYFPIELHPLLQVRAFTVHRLILSDFLVEGSKNSVHFVFSNSKRPGKLETLTH